VPEKWGYGTPTPKSGLRVPPPPQKSYAYACHYHIKSGIKQTLSQMNGYQNSEMSRENFWEGEVVNVGMLRSQWSSNLKGTYREYKSRSATYTLAESELEYRSTTQQQSLKIRDYSRTIYVP